MQKILTKKKNSAKALSRTENKKEKIAHPYVWRKKGVCGGVPVISGTRIPVSLIAELEKSERGIDEIISYYPHLNHAQIFDALSYYYDHKQEIDREIIEQRRALSQLLHTRK